MKLLKLIVCCDMNYGIGKDGKLPWKIKSEMQHFKNKTIKNGNNVCIMGRKTFYSIPKKYRPLCERQNIIISHSNNSELIDNEDILCFKSPHDCIEFIVFNEKNYDEFWIIGGESIYKEFLLNYQEYIDEIHLSKLSSSFMCDQFIEIPFENYEMIHEVKYDEYDYLIYKSK